MKKVQVCLIFIFLIASMGGIVSASTTGGSIVRNEAFFDNEVIISKLTSGSFIYNISSESIDIQHLSMGAFFCAFENVSGCPNKDESFSFSTEQSFLTYNGIKYNGFTNGHGFFYYDFGVPGNRWQIYTTSYFTPESENANQDEYITLFADYNFIYNLSGDYESGSASYKLIIQNYEEEVERISALESWKESITTQISGILTTLTGFATRITALEQNNSSENPTNESGAGTWSWYKKYISSSTRKKMVCDYAEENRLTHIEELGYTCDLTYTTSSTGRERVTCRCDKILG